MGNNSCVIHRQHISDHCKMQAAYLSKLIYEKPRGHNPFDTNWPEEINKARENWQEWEDFDKQERYGFVARLYKPKGYNPNAANGDEMCWPTLVFRGTDFDDFRGLGLHVRIRIDALATLIEDIRTRAWSIVGGVDETGMEDKDKSKGGQPLGVNAASGMPIFQFSPLSSKEQADQRRLTKERAIQRQIERAKQEAREKARQKALETTQEGTAERAAALKDAEHADSVLVEQTIILDADFLAAHQGDYSRKDALNAGFKVRPELSFTLQGPIKGLLAGPAEIKLEVLTKGGAGDWINNLLQGIGDIENSSQYQFAIDTAKDVMREYIKPSHDKRLTITGHSLGGGLATAADFTARYNYYKDKIQIYTLVFNTAGLHENTIQYIKDNSEYAKDVQAEHEKLLQQLERDFDEIVEETLARNKEQAKKCEPKPSLHDSAFHVFRVKDEILTTLEYTPHHIPFLQGIMDILDQRFPKPEGVDNQMPALSPGWNSAQQKAINAMMATNGHIVHPAARGYLPPKKKLEPMPVLFPLDAEEFPHLLALSAIFAKYGRWMRDDIEKFQSYNVFSICLNEMIDYLDSTIFKGKLSQYINSKGEDRSVLSLIPGGWRGYTLYLWGEISKLQRVMALSAEYHGMDYAIAAYEGILQQKRRERQKAEEAMMQHYTPSADAWQKAFNMRF